MLDRDLKERAGGLSELGWHVETADDCISLHKRFKNGKPHKTSTVSLTVWKRQQGDDGWRASKRPYRVESPRYERAKAYATLLPAEHAFFEEARAVAPGRRGAG